MIMRNKFDSFKKFLENSQIVSSRVGTINGLQLTLGKFDLMVFIKEGKRSQIPSIFTEISEQYDNSIMATVENQKEIQNAKQDFMNLVSQEIDQKFQETFNKECEKNENCLSNANDFCMVVQIDGYGNFMKSNPNNLKQIENRIDYNVKKYKPEALPVQEWTKEGIWTYTKYYHTPSELDWRPTNTVPEDYYSA